MSINATHLPILAALTGLSPLLSGPVDYYRGAVSPIIDIPANGSFLVNYTASGGAIKFMVEMLSTTTGAGWLPVELVRVSDGGNAQARFYTASLPHSLRIKASPQYDRGAAVEVTGMVM